MVKLRLATSRRSKLQLRTGSQYSPCNKSEEGYIAYAMHRDSLLKRYDLYHASVESNQTAIVFENTSRMAAVLWL